MIHVDRESPSGPSLYRWTVCSHLVAGEEVLVQRQAVLAGLGSSSSQAGHWETLARGLEWRGGQYVSETAGELGRDAFRGGEWEFRK